MKILILRTADTDTCPDGRVEYTGETVVVNCQYMAMAYSHQDHTHVILASGAELIVAENVHQVIASVDIVQEDRHELDHLFGS